MTESFFHKRRFHAAFYVVLSLLFLFLFQNCGPQFSTQASGNVTTLGSQQAPQIGTPQPNQPTPAPVTPVPNPVPAPLPPAPPPPPPPPMPPTLKFRAVNGILGPALPLQGNVFNYPLTVSTTQSVEVYLDKASTTDVTFSLRLDHTSGNFCPPSGGLLISGMCFQNLYEFIQTRSLAQNERDFEYAALQNPTSPIFNWDLDISTTQIYSIPAGQTSTRINYKVSNDTRATINKSIRLAITKRTGDAVAANDNSGYFEILLRKILLPPQIPTIPTYSKLMNPLTGVLGLRCASCHNSTMRAGGWELTNFNEMVANGIVNPANPQRSKMWLRTDYDNTAEGNPKMPMNGRLTVEELTALRLWMSSGQPNN